MKYVIVWKDPNNNGTISEKEIEIVNFENDDDMAEKMESSMEEVVIMFPLAWVLSAVKKEQNE